MNDETVDELRYAAFVLLIVLGIVFVGLALVAVVCA